MFQFQYRSASPLALTEGKVTQMPLCDQYGRPIVSAIVSADASGNGDLGKVNTRHFNVAVTTLTRPANTTPYSINDSISDNATAGSVTALSAVVSDTNDDPIDINEVLLETTDTGPGTAGIYIRAHLFRSDPTVSSGVQAGDNVTWSNKKAGWVGAFSGLMRPFYDGSMGVLVPEEGGVRIVNPSSGGKTLWVQYQTLGIFTPSANSTTFIGRLKGWQGRT